jgi:hypothetical protein
MPLAFEFVDLSSNQIREKYQSIDNLEMFTIYHQTRVNSSFLYKYLHQVADGILVFSNHIFNVGSMFLGWYDIGYLIDWCLTRTLAICQLYRSVVRHWYTYY